MHHVPLHSKHLGWCARWYNFAQYVLHLSLSALVSFFYSLLSALMIYFFLFSCQHCLRGRVSSSTAPGQCCHMSCSASSVSGHLALRLHSHLVCLKTSSFISSSRADPQHDFCGAKGTTAKLSSFLFCMSKF